MTNFIKLYGFHATIHALANSERSIKKIFLTENARRKINLLEDINLEKFNYEITTTNEKNTNTHFLKIQQISNNNKNMKITTKMLPSSLQQNIFSTLSFFSK